MRSIGITFLAWYACGAFALLTLLASLITYVPNAEAAGALFTVGSLIAALLSGTAALLLGRIPPTHWVHTSRSLRATAIVVVSAATLLVIMMG
jgi:hypothetical protein